MRRPEMLGLPRGAGPGSTEEYLLSGDTLDVSFRYAEQWVAAEVRSRISDQLDIQRGIFQCVKYRAVMHAQSRAMGSLIEVRVLLVLGGELPDSLIPLRNMFAIDVLENAGRGEV